MANAVLPARQKNDKLIRWHRLNTSGQMAANMTFAIWRIFSAPPICTLVPQLLKLPKKWGRRLNDPFEQGFSGAHCAKT
jgi:hypothetical protein